MKSQNARREAERIRDSVSNEVWLEISELQWEEAIATAKQAAADHRAKNTPVDADGFELTTDEESPRGRK